MQSDNYFLIIENPEVEELTQYLYIYFLKGLNVEEQKDLLKILDEVELYEIQFGKFYKNKEDLRMKIELKEHVIYAPDPITDLYKEFVIVKKTYSFGLRG